MPPVLDSIYWQDGTFLRLVDADWGLHPVGSSSHTSASQLLKGLRSENTALDPGTSNRAWQQPVSDQNSDGNNDNNSMKVSFDFKAYLQSLVTHKTKTSCELNGEQRWLLSTKNASWYSCLQGRWHIVVCSSDTSLSLWILDIPEWK